MKILAKKSPGQHFLIDSQIIDKIIALIQPNTQQFLIEVGAGKGILTQHIISFLPNFCVVELDDRMISLLSNKFPQLTIIHQDILTVKFTEITAKPIFLIGNFPYYISGQLIAFIIENHKFIENVIGMFQLEVALRLCAAPNTKNYGIPSVLMQYFFETEVMMTIPNTAFLPIPKVQSAIVKLTHKKELRLVNIEQFTKTVKTAFAKRRKQLHNNFHPLILPEKYRTMRAEMLSLSDFVLITNFLYTNEKSNKCEII